MIAAKSSKDSRIAGTVVLPSSAKGLGKTSNDFVSANKSCHVLSLLRLRHKLDLGCKNVGK